MRELTDCNVEIGHFAHEWAKDAGDLKAKEKRYERLYKAAMRGTQGRNADERSATAQAAVEHIEPGLAEGIEELVGRVETYKTLFKTIERRAGDAQSILSAHKESMRSEDFQPTREMPTV